MNSVMLPAVVIRPILFPLFSVNQRLLSGPTAMLAGLLAAVGIVNSLEPPAVVMRPILFVAYSVNQRLPSGPFAIPEGWLAADGIANSVIAHSMPSTVSADS